jgi:hypothetical protein
METTGCGTAIVTPFRADGAIDEQALRALVRWQIDAGIDFLVACGSTGEAATLDEDEWLDTIRIVVDAAAGRVPVWAGCTHNSTRTLLRQAALLSDVEGVDTILSANPYYNKPNQEGQFQHFLAWQMPCTRSRCACTTCRAGRRPTSSRSRWFGWPKPHRIFRHQGSQRNLDPNCKADPPAAAILQSLFRRRRPGAGDDRRRGAWAHQRGFE